MTMNELERVMLNELNELDFDYYKNEFGYNEWQSIVQKKLNTYSGWIKDKTSIKYSPSGVKLQCSGETRMIKINDLKKMFENQDIDKQLTLF